MSKFDSGPSRPPNIFKNGQPRDTYTTSEPGLDQLKCSLPIYEATRVPLPDSPIEENRHSFAPTALETNETKGGSTESFSPNFKDGCNDGYARDNGPANDNVSNLPNIFRLLDLYRDHGSGGLVEKVLIDQSCLRRLLNTFVPGSYESVSKIDFKALDKCTIKPLGMYGSKHEILRFLSEMNCLTDNSEKLLLSSIETSSDLRSGLYLALPFGRGAEGPDTERAYIFYWPEDSTWDDKAISSVRRNRITFIRYLSKLTDQMIALISPDQARAMVWTASRRSANGHSNQPELFEESRMFSFEVERSTEQEEDAIALAGFTVKLDTYNAPNFKGTVQTYLVPGEEKPGIITALLQPATALYKAQSETMYPMQLRSMIESKTQPIILGNLPAEQLKILAEHGLREMYPKPFAQYEKRMELEEGNRNSEYNQSVQAMKDTIQQDMKDLNRFMVLSVRDCYSELHPSLGISGFTPENESPHWGRLREKYLGLADVPQSLKKSLQSGDIEDPDFIDLKLAWHTIRDYLLQDPPPLPTRQVAFIAEIVGDNSDGGWSVVTRGKGTKHTSKRIWQGVKKLVFDFFGYKAKPPTSLLSDLDFIRALRPLADMFPSISPFTEGITSYLHTYLHNLGKRLARNLLDKIVKEEERRLEDLISLQRATRSQEESQATKQSLLNELRALMPSKSSSHSLRINSITNENLHGLTKLRVVIERTIEQGPQMLYTIYPLELTEYDVQKCQSNAQHIPNPTFNSMLVFKFALDEERKIKFVQLVKDKCLVVISGSKQFHLYIDNNVRLPNVIKHGPPKLSLNYDRLGDPNQCIFALDESTRSLALLHNPNSKGPVLSLFGFDEAFAVVRARGSPFLLKDWYDTEAKIDKMCFVSGAEEVCLIETSGRARILSLVTLSFRPASIQISGQIVDAFSAPDGSCLLLLVVQADEAPIQHKLLVFHWASFGATETGINPTVLPASSVGRIVTSFEGRNHIHLVSLSREDAVATSVSLQIKQKATEFSFRSNQTESTTSNIDSETVNNCLIDCHMDVWTRFPVAPAIVRSTLSCLGREPRKLVFASPYNMESVGTYFSRMIVKFERTTCKPINTELESTSVISYSESFSALVQGTQCSRYLLGSFVVELICLIPLHLAITRDNRFIPLKDGVLNPEHERSLLGADVPAIIDSLSIGWYESLFQSYMATKPVRVVSSMGEQSVGKSYCLNHFVDTSFAGSAMRTTEGVWLSCTPTDDYLLVSLDFEGVHSIERSAQEDALLVLFNTAISNLVLFRNNFALSRDIAGLFQSFQSSAMVLDPDSNPSLFNSTLAIIIKDVTDSDSRDIVKEFSLKFQRIVQKEQEQNFISRLHRGKVQIIPWPVINSSSFYTLFNHLRRYLDVQPITHKSGGIFLHSIKTLMAKIKANDWGSLDQNLATHRAQQIERELYTALNRGSVDGIDTQAPLKNLDTDEDIPMHGPNVIFFIPDISSASIPGDEAEIENILVTLNSFCLSNATIGQRHVIGDQPYVEFLQQQLFGLLDRRLEYVRSWVQVNVQRFPANIQDIRNIYNKIDTMALGMRTAVRLCMETCSSCHYLCTRPFRHSNEHQCGTTHICPFSCEVSDDHPEPVGCGLPAGHSAQHMCNVKAHSCGHNCHLIDKNGCARSCVKPMYHESEHLCSARLHSCGEPCSLQDVNVGYRCPGLCHIPWDEPHTRHRCGNSSSCPLECQLCRRLCRERDHFHGLDASAIHLCGQSHDCTSPCAARGICRIETQPSAVEEQFSGRHETFQYTRYSQVEQRLTCVIPIPPGELQHIGEHSHTTDKKAFHYCNVRCPSCQYLCTLPLEHSQQLHETSHGSMMTTQWAIQGADQDARYELNGRNFGVGDEGAPMLCHLVCSAQGRHVHIDFCREAGNCREVAELKHIDECMHPDPTRPKDWISHRLKWARSGFQDPYSREQQAEFAKCDVLCAGPEHNATVTTAANPSYCNLPIFHQPHERHPAPVNGYVSGDGHRFDCPDPARLQQSYHVIFVIDSSGSMGLKDRTPLSNTPVTALLRSHCNNRYGAVLSALHGFWSSREIGNPNTEARQDAYSVVTFDTSPTTRVTNDFTSTTNQLLSQLLQTSARGGTDFNLALSHAQALIQTHWNSSRTPVLVFLSDGQCTLDRNIVYDLCRACVQLGKPLAFYSVSFGPERSSTPLRDMVQIAQEIYASAPQDTTSNIQRDSCAYYNAMDEIQLAGTFLGIANSLHKPRASLISQSGRRAL